MLFHNILQLICKFRMELHMGTAFRVCPILFLHTVKSSKNWLKSP